MNKIRVSPICKELVKVVEPFCAHPLALSEVSLDTLHIQM